MSSITETPWTQHKKPEQYNNKDTKQTYFKEHNDSINNQHHQKTQTKTQNITRQTRKATKNKHN